MQMRRCGGTLFLAVLCSTVGLQVGTSVHQFFRLCELHVLLCCARERERDRATLGRENLVEVMVKKTHLWQHQQPSINGAIKGRFG